MASVPFSQAVQAMKDAKTQAVMHTIALANPINRWMKVKPIRNLTLERSIDNTPGTPYYVGYNGTISTYSSGTTRIAKDAVARLAMPVKLDLDLANLDSDWEDEEAKQTRLGAEGVGLKFNDDFFLGLGALGSTFLDPIGVYRRLSDGVSSLGGDGTIPAQQLVNFGGPVTMEKVDELIRAVPERQGTTRVLFVNSEVKQQITNLTRDPSYRGQYSVQISEDDFGKQCEKYGGVIIAVVERYDNYNSALSFTETTTGLPTLGTGTTGTASMWCIGFGDEEQCYGFAKGEAPTAGASTMNPGNIGMVLEPFMRVPGQLHKISASRWLFGFATDGPRWGARGYNISRN